MGRKIFLKVMLMDGLEMRACFLFVKDIPNPADGRNPRAENAVGQAAFAVLVLGSFLLEQLERFGRPFGLEALKINGRFGSQTLPFHLLVEVFAIPEV